MDDDRIKRVYNLEIKKDLHEIKVDKDKFIKAIREGLGEDINSFQTYVKKEPSLYQKLKQRINRIFRVL